MSRMLQALKQLHARGAAARQSTPPPPIRAARSTHTQLADALAKVPLASELPAAQPPVLEIRRRAAPRHDQEPLPSPSLPGVGEETTVGCEEAGRSQRSEEFPSNPEPDSQHGPIARCDLGGLFGHPSIQQLREYLRTAQSMVAQLPSDRSAALMFVGMATGDEAAIVRLAAVLAEQGAGETLLIDGGFRRPMLPDSPLLRGQRGMVDVLLGSVDWREAVLATDVPHLHFLRGGHFPDEGRPADNLRFAPLLDELRRHYGLVLVRTETAAPAEFAQLARHCDAAYLFLQLHRTSQRAAQDAIRCMAECGAQVLGCVATGA